MEQLLRLTKALVVTTGVGSNTYLTDISDLVILFLAADVNR